MIDTKLKEIVKKEIKDLSREQITDLIVLYNNMIYNLIEDLKDIDKYGKLYTDKGLFNMYRIRAEEQTGIKMII